ncbi:hypothetical protein PMAYCL1PPCAC_09911, partial [Pristionchus mayeri]
KEVYGFGPGVQPTEHYLIQILENRNTNRFILGTLESMTSEWLKEVSKDLEEYLRNSRIQGISNKVYL